MDVKPEDFEVPAQDRRIRIQAKLNGGLVFEAAIWARPVPVVGEKPFRGGLDLLVKAVDLLYPTFRALREQPQDGLVVTILDDF